ncbi:DUF6973 domain-containing protein [Robertkochia solimangrovi]|uniref:DUF6973 domain-containing protein n=1 Tax=Robertkochia solimangrovi TaxID=2213046 RepID=UPI0011810CEA|nr:hypothetical protein [Robertkochia solimangrovi]TRZ45955.1 hypothetical protein DMZ48_01390 [Robertkochia solimangrovi]
MKLSELIRSLDFSQLLSLNKYFLSNPLFFIATITATKSCMLICNDQFGDTHHQNNQANAFRHAFWNAMIIRQCLKYTSKVENAMSWSKKITDWHEEFSPNERLARVMDLHNNAVGRTFYLNTFGNSRPELSEMTISYRKLADHSIQIYSSSIGDDLSDSLVYIEQLKSE